MEQSEYIADKNNPRTLYKLKNALYELKQATRVWNKELDA